MPRTAAVAPGIVIGVIGTGPLDSGDIETLLAEYLGSVPEGEIRFVVPITDDHFTDATAALVEFATNNADTAGTTYVAVTKSGEKSKHLAPYIAGATQTVAVEDPGLQIIKTLEKAPQSVLLALLGDAEYGDDEAYRIINAAMEGGITALELTDQLVELQPGEEGADDAVAEAEPIYSRSDLEAMESSELRALAKTLLETVPRATTAVITAILDAQGGEPVDEAPEEPEDAVEEPEDEPTEVPDDSTGSDLAEAITSLTYDFITALKELLVEEAPAEPEPVAEAPKRRGRPAAAAAPVEEAPAPKRGPGRPRKQAAAAAPAKRRFGG